MITIRRIELKDKVFGESLAELDITGETYILPSISLTSTEVLKAEKISRAYKLPLSFRHKILEVKGSWNSKNIISADSNEDIVSKVNHINTLINKTNAKISYYVPRFSQKLVDYNKKAKLTYLLSIKSDVNFVTILEGSTVDETISTIQECKEKMKELHILKPILLLINMAQDEKLFFDKCKLDNIEGIIAIYCEPKLRAENFNTIAMLLNRPNFIRILTQVPKKSSGIGKGAILPNMVLVADVVSNKTVYRGRSKDGTEDGKPLKEISQEEKDKLAFTNATRHYYPYNANFTLNDYDSLGIRDILCKCALCRDIISPHLFFELYPHHRYEVCAIHDTFSFYNLVQEERKLIAANQLRAFLETSKYGPETVKKLFGLDLTSNDLRKF